MRVKYARLVLNLVSIVNYRIRQVRMSLYNNPVIEIEDR